MDLLPQLLIPLAIIGIVVYLLVRRNRERAGNAPLRGEIAAQVCFETSLDRVSALGTGGFGGMSGNWIPLRGPKRLTVGTGAFMVSAPQALREFVFTGRESSIEFTRMPSRLVDRDRDWIVITGQAGGREVQLAIAQDNLRDVWQALAGTGAALAGNGVPAGHLTRPMRRPVRPGSYSLRRLAVPLVIVLMADAATWLTAIALPWLGDLGNSGFLLAMIMFVVWFYRARVNADGHGWPQRQSPGAAIWSWFVPVVNFFFPFQIMADIWRAGLPARERAKPATLPGIWWTCLVAFFMLSSFLLPSTAGSHANPAWYVGMPIKTAGVLAAIMTALVVQKVSSGPLGRKTDPAADVAASAIP